MLPLYQNESNTLCKLFLLECLCSIEQKRLLLNTPSLLADTDSLYLQFNPTIWALQYTCKHTNCTISLQECHLPTALRLTKKNSSSTETEQCYLCRFLSSTAQIYVDRLQLVALVENSQL